MFGDIEFPQQCGTCYWFEMDKPVVPSRFGVSFGLCSNPECVWHDMKRGHIEGSVCIDYCPVEGDRRSLYDL